MALLLRLRVKDMERGSTRSPPHAGLRSAAGEDVLNGPALTVRLRASGAEATEFRSPNERPVPPDVRAGERLQPLHRDVPALQQGAEGHPSRSCVQRQFLFLQHARVSPRQPWIRPGPTGFEAHHDGNGPGVRAGRSKLHHASMDLSVCGDLRELGRPYGDPQGARQRECRERQAPCRRRALPPCGQRPDVPRSPP
ncbi:hypothetical protein SAMN00790413_04033 [Deinococcus hopiensis KR-140]|uniref:Uncharacterized protein n=1 Tax=Deinococcus hopiensis KR-140 TaxID=695939 RepID=A0A1W1UN21_9DEIO|nr:hypothetical protein SAMN00790413_04033 [Deinococcus hopiensis KR-140]